MSALRQRCAILLLTPGTTAIAASVSIQLEGGAFKVTGSDAPRTEPAKGWPSVFAIYAGSGDIPPLLGSYTVEAGSLIFRPRFPFASGVHYRAVFRPLGGGPQLEKIFEGPPREIAPLARVERLYPSGDVLPSNQLRLYIYFSTPMSRGEAGQRIRMLDENGKVLPGVFLPGEELWAPDFRRLTMTLDPGRIKRGLTSNEAMGPPIVEGKRYTLTIDRDWPDARGVRMLPGSLPQALSRRAGPAQSAGSQAVESDLPQGGYLRRSGGEFSGADELSANAEDASGFRRAGKRERRQTGNRVAFDASGTMESGQLPTGG